MLKKVFQRTHYKKHSHWQPFLTPLFRAVSLRRMHLFGVMTASLVLLSLGCKRSGDSGDEADSEMRVRTPATAVTINVGSLQKDAWVNATSTYLNSSVINSTITGYVTRSGLYPGEYVHAGQVLFTLQTKEASILADQLPDSLKFNGKIKIKAPLDGFINQLNHQQGDYVQDGEQLCTISSSSSFAFIMQVPVDLVNKINLHQQVVLQLPDHTTVNGNIISGMPSMDSLSQTEAYLVRVASSRHLPQNMIAKVKIISQAAQDAQIVPKEAVLSDEAENGFWVMKMINDSMAVRVNIKKGIEDGGHVQILSPQFPPGTRLLNSGNYGLPDTAFVMLGKLTTP